METLKNLLHANSVFASLTPAELTVLAQLASSRSYEKDETVILYGDVWSYLFLVSKGSVNAVKESGEGRSLIVTTFLTGDLFWGLAFFQDNAPMPVTLKAREASRLHLWSRETIAPIFERNGRAGWELCRLMAGRMQRASAILEEMAFHPVAGRLARLLLDHFEMAGDAAISRHLTLDEMAARIGSTREMVCRALYGFSDKKLIEVTRTEFILTDRQGLFRLVENG
ncbi:MAG: Crp/Fnr family transcriptional regulator [Anaerolineales bacterium]|nr:Crp/Fnr family transcriptional regulator [Anaerolineales bacterium]